MGLFDRKNSTNLSETTLSQVGELAAGLNNSHSNVFDYDSTTVNNTTTTDFGAVRAGQIIAERSLENNAIGSGLAFDAINKSQAGAFNLVETTNYDALSFGRAAMDSNENTFISSLDAVGRNSENALDFVQSLARPDVAANADSLGVMKYGLIAVALWAVFK